MHTALGSYYMKNAMLLSLAEWSWKARSITERTTERLSDAEYFESETFLIFK